METIHGKRTHTIHGTTLLPRLAGYRRVLVDLGTGDGRFVQHVARTDPDCFVIGIDACRENLRTASRTIPPNALFVIANAAALPAELTGVATHITINFPWGSLLRGLVIGDPAILGGLRLLARPETTLEIRLNSGALIEAGWSLEAGGAAVYQALRSYGFVVEPCTILHASALRICPTTWAKRLAFGRDPRALYLRATWPDQHAQVGAASS